MKRFALFFIRHPFSQVHLKKDVGLFSIYFSNIFEKVELLKIGKEKKDSIEYKNIIIKDLFRWKKMYSNDWESSKIYEVFCIIMSFFYLVRNRDISHIMLFHINRYSEYFFFFLFHSELTINYHGNKQKLKAPKTNILFRLKLNLLHVI